MCCVVVAEEARYRTPAGVALADPAAALPRPAIVAGERRGDRADEPRVDREPLAARGLLDARLERLGQPQVDARRRGVVRLRRGRRPCLALRLERFVRRCGSDDELGFAGTQAQLDRSGRELARDVVRRRRERLEQHQPDGGLERRGQALGERPGIVAAGFRRDRELIAELLDIVGQVHGASMAP